ncbi:SDR family oxidoreductase [Streptomyces candidus]|uniref:NAD(P)-dependent dehydrogenase (Short-subunit alcohol dehydrogenase family) n=1 Tax=Streptomyces candidus TaxID=67283 RepID=A0A7X0HEH3_9ACTN|nr:SDR family oxidoreductase [Streptomyces candidus]MBB6436157.1 NAD(P)-dependent dehydrogenase (short-subunit alcohol dehydrogenase family) [Streptomyces candidus]GHH43828.1 short-chain dehydrogenase [Streptomyces candidus]
MKTVVVTGATSGIGKAVALDLAAHGYQVVATARSSDKAEKLLADAAEHGLVLHTVLLEVTDPHSCQEAVTEIAEQTGGGPWALVNNAGLAHAGAFEDVSEDAARAVLEVNLLGAARMTRLMLPAMRRRGSGRIVNMSSVGGKVPVPLNGWYCASKHALEALTDALRMETASSGIRCCLIEPGFIDTPMLRAGLAGMPAGSHFSDGYDAARRLVARSSPPGPELVARTVRRALAARTPRRRYRVGREAALVPLTRCLPSAVTDHLARRATGLLTRGQR